MNQITDPSGRIRQENDSMKSLGFFFLANYGVKSSRRIHSRKSKNCVMSEKVKPLNVISELKIILTETKLQL